MSHEKSIEQLEAEIKILCEMLCEARAELDRGSNDPTLLNKAASIDSEIERRRLLLDNMRRLVKLTGGGQA